MRRRQRRRFRRSRHRRRRLRRHRRRRRLQPALVWRRRLRAEDPFLRLRIKANLRTTIIPKIWERVSVETPP